MSKEIIEKLQTALADPKFADYSCFVMAGRDLKAGNLDLALNRIRVDIDKLICIDYDLYEYVQDVIAERKSQ